jgi:hypothetical protein
VGQEDQGEEYQSLGFLIWIMLAEVSRKISIEIMRLDIKINMKLMTKIDITSSKEVGQIANHITLIFGVHQAYPSCAGAL